MPRTCALILPFQPTLHRVSCSNEIIKNAPKNYKTHQNMSLGSNVVDRVGSLQKIPMRLRGTNFCINCSSSTRFAPSFMRLWNHPKCTQTLQNAPIHAFRVQWGWIGCIHCVKFWCDFVARTFALIAPVQTILHRPSWSNEKNQMHQNTTKRTNTCV